MGLAEALKQFQIPPQYRQMVRQSMALSTEQLLQAQCDRINRQPGQLTGYDCPECLNRGMISEVWDGAIVERTCRCMDIRRSIRRARTSGLGDLLADCTFDAYVASEPWQQRLKASAQQYVRDYIGSWFYIGGQVGAGKTHLCTAIVGELLRTGRTARYMLWRDEIVRIKACVNDDAAYSRMVDPLKAVDVLYIDDLFKSGKDANGRARPPSPADISAAFELLNCRYNNKRQATVISSEFTMDELLSFDEGVGSRIYQRSKEYCHIIGRAPAKNYRLTNGSKE